MPLRVRPLPFLDRMELAYAAADAVVARAGATSIAELTVCGLASLLIPYPHATADHQDANARELERAGAAEVLADADLRVDDLAARITRLADEPDRRRAMGECAAAWARPDAAARLAELVVDVAS
jgi:UDP-N-acetylglucosamine--N-acetylmuramyl-(pentapeptide) pyrophosphoryl-undecaprenol N-acetylglucosamine transferase